MAVQRRKKPTRERREKQIREERDIEKIRVGYKVRGIKEEKTASLTRIAHSREHVLEKERLLVLYGENGLTVKEIAKKLGYKEQTVVNKARVLNVRLSGAPRSQESIAKEKRTRHKMLIGLWGKLEPAEIATKVGWSEAYVIEEARSLRLPGAATLSFRSRYPKYAKSAKNATDFEEAARKISKAYPRFSVGTVESVVRWMGFRKGRAEDRYSDMVRGAKNLDDAFSILRKREPRLEESVILRCADKAGVPGAHGALLGFRRERMNVAGRTYRLKKDHALGEKLAQQVSGFLKKLRRGENIAAERGSNAALLAAGEVYLGERLEKGESVEKALKHLRNCGFISEHLKLLKEELRDET